MYKVFQHIPKIHLWAAIVATVLLTACNNTDYLRYDTQQQDALFLDYRTVTGATIDSIDYTFGFDPADSHDIRIPLRLVGTPKATDRSYEVEIVDSLSTMKAGVNYEFDSDSLRIAAGKVEGAIRLRLLRGKDPEILEQSKSLVFKLKENGTFRPLGEQTFKVIYSDIRPNSAPRWWDRFKLPAYKFELAQRFFYYFYQTEKINPEVFHARIQRFGDYFQNYDKVRRRFGEVLLDNFATRYAIMPLYEETKNDPNVKWPSAPSIY